MSSLKRLQATLKKHQIEAILVSNNINIQWLTGFSGSWGYAIVTEDKALFITDSRYAIQASQEVKELEVTSYGTGTTHTEFIKSYLKQYHIDKLHFEQSTSFEEWQEWAKAFAPVELVPEPHILESLRSIKTDEEIEKLRKSCALADACMAHVQRMIQPGIREYDLTLEIEFFFRRHSANLAFSPIIVSGANSAKPHGKPTEKRLEPGDFVTLDFGCILAGYNSDITRTFVVSEASHKHTEIYNAVLEAQIAAIQGLKPGMMGVEVDKIARDIISGYGYGSYFQHGLGHSLGRLCHDGQRLNPESLVMVEPGQVWTIEPGIYIEGFGGVRIEDDVVVTKKSVEILTHSPKELLVL